MLLPWSSELTRWNRFSRMAPCSRATQPRQPPCAVLAARSRPRRACQSPPGPRRRPAGPRTTPVCASSSSRDAERPGSPDEQPSSSAPAGGEQPRALDLNELQTALNRAIAAEDYAQASRVRDALRLLLHEDGDAAGEAGGGDWRSLGVLPWLAERAESLGFRLPSGTTSESGRGAWLGSRGRLQRAPALGAARHPASPLARARRCPCAEVQKRAARVILDGNDAVVQSQTGSGKTLAFLLPALSLLSYPPETYPDDLKASGRAAGWRAGGRGSQPAAGMPPPA